MLTGIHNDGNGFYCYNDGIRWICDCGRINPSDQSVCICGRESPFSPKTKPANPSKPGKKKPPENIGRDIMGVKK